MHGNSNIKLILYIVQNNESWLNKFVVIVYNQNTSQKKSKLVHSESENSGYSADG